jgi:O-methyltransferase
MAGAISEQMVRPSLFDEHIRERLARQSFFFNAFKALRFNAIPGDYAEFGSGWITFALAYDESRRHGYPAKLWAFDSFQGLPAQRDSDDHHPRWSEGKMAITLAQFHDLCADNGIPRDAYATVPGFYAETLVAMSPTDEPTDIGLAYVDCDLYSSTAAVLSFLAPRLKHGMIVAFDDYFCWSPSQISGERRAMQEFVAENDSWEWIPYIQFGWSGMSFLLEDRALGTSL